MEACRRSAAEDKELDPLSQRPEEQCTDPAQERADMSEPQLLRQTAHIEALLDAYLPNPRLPQEAIARMMLKRKMVWDPRRA